MLCTTAINTTNTIRTQTGAAEPAVWILDIAKTCLAEVLVLRSWRQERSTEKDLLPTDWSVVTERLAANLQFLHIHTGVVVVLLETVPFPGPLLCQ